MEIERVARIRVKTTDEYLAEYHSTNEREIRKDLGELITARLSQRRAPNIYPGVSFELIEWEPEEPKAIAAEQRERVQTFETIAEPVSYGEIKVGGNDPDETRRPTFDELLTQVRTDWQEYKRKARQYEKARRIFWSVAIALQLIILTILLWW